MINFDHPARRLTVAAGFAVLISAAPAVALAATPDTHSAARTVADSSSFDASGTSDCTTTKTKGSFSFSCSVSTMEGGASAGTPSEQTLTAENKGNR